MLFSKYTVPHCLQQSHKKLERWQLHTRIMATAFIQQTRVREKVPLTRYQEPQIFPFDHMKPSREVFVSDAGEVESIVRDFYDKYWPSHLPSKEDLAETRSHLGKIVPNGAWNLALDAGCGLGVCSVALSEISAKVVALDISAESLRAARHLAERLGRRNIEFTEGTLMNIPYKNGTFDLILCWGVLMYVPSLERVFGELIRTLREKGTIIVAVHRKTLFTPLHNMIRRICLRIPNSARGAAIKSAAVLIRIVSTLLNRQAIRDDLSFEAKVEDFYFIPFKRFVSVREIKGLLGRYGLSSDIVYEYTGRFRSTSNVILRGTKQLSSRN